MIPWEFIERAEVPNSAQALELWRRGEEFVIRVDGKELMGSRAHGSEDALAQLTLNALPEAHRAAARVLVGGLGMGFTLAAALRELGPQGAVVVAELVPAVIAWNKGALSHLAGAPLDDPRTSVHTGDVGELLREPGEGFDAILLDVDNGPDWLTREENGWLYRGEGLATIARALRPGGALAIWSATDDVAFTKLLMAGSLRVTKHTARSHNGRGRRHTVWIAVKRVNITR
jgi:spermidine synthase